MKNILLEISKGNFKSVLKRILENDVNLNSNNALKVIVSCCTVCTKQECPIDDETLSKLLIICAKQITDMSEASCLNNYLQAICFITKYLLEKNYSMIIELEKVLIPDCLPSYLTDKQEHIFIYMSSMMYNTVLSTSKKKKHLDDSIFCLSIASLKVLAIVGTKSVILDRIYKYLQVFSTSEINIAQLHQFYDTALNLMNTAHSSNETFAVVFKIFQSILQFLLKICFEKWSLDHLKIFMDRTLLEMCQLCNTQEHILMCAVLKSILLFACPFEKYLSASELRVTLMKCYKSLEKMNRIYGTSENMYLMCTFIGNVFYKLSQFYYKSVAEELWKKVMTCDVQILLYKLLRIAGDCLQKYKLKCYHCATCEIKTAVHDVANLFFVTLYLCKLSLSKNMISKSLITEALSYGEWNCDLIVDIKSKNCSYWKSVWLETGCALYNMSINLYKLENTECVPYFNLFTKYVIKLEGTKVSVIKENVLDVSLNCFVEAHLKYKNYQTALIIAAMHMFLSCANVNRPSYMQWVRAKAVLIDQNSSDKELTVVAVLEKYAEEIKKFCPDLKVDKEIATQLLMYELQQYKQHWPSKVPMMMAFKQIYKIANCSTAANIFVKIWSNCTITVNEELLPILKQLLEKFELEVSKADDLHSNLVLGCLYFHYYKYQMEDLVLKNSAEMKNVVIPLKKPQPYDTPVNENDECDMVTVFEHLKCDSHVKITKYLNSALMIFEQHLINFIKYHETETLQTYGILTILTRIAHEYQLHCNVIYCLRAWMLYFKVSKFLNDNLAVLESISFVISMVDRRSKTAVELLEYAQETIRLLSEDQSARKFEVLTNFYISTGLKNIEDENQDAALADFLRAQLSYEDMIKHSDSPVTKVRLYYLHFKLIMLPCNYKAVNHKKNSVIKIHQALHSIMDYFKGSGRKSAYCISILFDVTTTISNWYKWLRMPREVRCYSREVAVLAQQLVVPVRAAQFLVVLAHADLQSCRFDDCHVKIVGLTSILCLAKENTSRLQHDTETKKIKIYEEDVRTLEHQMEEMSLDLPVMPTTINTNSASPILMHEPFKLPSFLKHWVYCECYYCNSIEYQALTVMTTHLNALISFYRDNSVSKPQEYFFGALHMIKCFKKHTADNRQKYFSLFEVDFLKETENIFWESHACILLDYANCLLRSEKKKEALKANNELTTLVSERKLRNMYLYTEAFVQKVNLTWSFKTENKMVAIDQENYEDGTNTSSFDKTPESKVSKVRFKYSCSSEFSFPIKSAVKCLPLSFSDLEDETTETKKAVKKKSPSKIPSLNPKVKIYTPAYVEKSNKKKVLLRVPVPVYKQNETKDTSDDAVVPSSPNAYTPSSAKSALQFESCLKSKTKLLTEKLMKSTRKNQDVEMWDEIDPKNVNENFTSKSKSSVKNSVRKNLMNEMTDSSSHSISHDNDDDGILNKGFTEKSKSLSKGVATRKSSRTNTKK